MTDRINGFARDEHIAALCLIYSAEQAQRSVDKMFEWRRQNPTATLGLSWGTLLLLSRVNEDCVRRARDTLQALPPDCRGEVGTEIRRCSKELFGDEGPTGWPPL